MRRINFNIIIFLCFTVLMGVSVQDAHAQFWKKKKKKQETQETTSTPEKKKNKFEKLLEKSTLQQAKGGFVNLYRDGDKIYVEYPLEYIGREILMAGTISSVSDPQYLNVGFKYNDPLHLRVDLQDSTIILRQPNMLIMRNAPEEAEEAIRKNYTDKEFLRIPMYSYNADSTGIVFDVTDLFKAKEFTPITSSGPIMITSGKSGKQYFGTMKSFDDNASILLYQDVDVSINLFMFSFKLGSVSTASTVSMLLLPKEKMKARIQDSRIGVFPTFGHELLTLPKLEISQTEDGIRSFILANRWRLEPKDVEAWKRGELVEPVKPIVWYVDNTFPEEWKPAIHRAVLRWNPAFEKIGLKNVMQVRDFPLNDSTFDPDNLKYSCIRYSPSPVANAMGPSWVDPTTGEILNASVIVYNDIVKLNNFWRFIQTAQIDPRVRCKKMPKEVMDESIEYVVAHEIGHTLGLMHNMAASNAFPVDSLRSATFTQKYGTTPSIMDYARYNYVAQPGDEGVKLTPPSLGVYDEYAIRWLYTPVPDAKDMWEESQIAERIIDEHANDLYYRYGRQQLEYRYDPSALEEDLGDDPIKAGSYGVKNLKYILAHVNEWIQDDEDASHRTLLYSEIVGQYFRYLSNVIHQIGGIRLSQVKENTSDMLPVEPLARDVQKASLNWVLREVRNCTWINAPELTKNFGLATSSSSKIATEVAQALLTTVPAHVTLANHVANGKNAYSAREYFNDLYAGVFAPTIQGKKLTLEDKILQNAIITVVAKAVENAGKPVSSFVGDQYMLNKTDMLPSLYEMQTYGLLPRNLFSGELGAKLKMLEAKHGKGCVAEAYFADGFGKDANPFQGEVSIKNINEIPFYQYEICKKIYALLKSKAATAHQDDRAHYEYLLLGLKQRLEK